MRSKCRDLTATPTNQSYRSTRPRRGGRLRRPFHDCEPNRKAERSLNEQRDDADQFADYLSISVFPRLAAGALDGMEERKLQDVAEDLGCSVTTVQNRYQRAFELIVGHPYSRKMWVRVFGPLKLSRLYWPTRVPSVGAGR